MLQLQSSYIGLDVGSASLSIAVLRKTGKGWSVVHLKEIAEKDGMHPLSGHLKDGILMSSIPTRDVLMRPCEIPLKKPKDLFAALNFHVEPLLPYPLEQGIVQGQMIEKLESSTLLNVFCVRKERLSQHLGYLKNYQIEPEIVTSRLHGLAALSELLPPTAAPILIAHASEDMLTFVLVEKGRILAARSVDSKKDFFADIQKSFLNFTLSSKLPSFDSIYFFGKDPALKEAIEEMSGKPVFLPTSPFFSLTQEEWAHFGLAIGTALASKTINFRQENFSYPHPFKKVKKPLAIYFSLCALLTGAVVFYSHLKESDIKRDLEQAYHVFLKAEKMEPPKVALQTPKEFLTALAAHETVIKARPEIFPLYPQVPKIREVMGWLASIDKQPGTEAITIDSFYYQMVKRPDFTHKDDHYKVRVDIEFSTKDPGAARAFQDALKCSESLVDTREEIQWLALKGKYKISFFLKDKTRYG